MSRPEVRGTRFHSRGKIRRVARHRRRRWAAVREWLRPVLLIARREVQDQRRDWRILTPLLGLTLFFPLLANFTARRMVAYMEQFDAVLIAERLYPFLLLVVGFFPISISLVVALESFAGERERGTIEPLLAAPLSDAQLYVGKLLAVLVLPLAGSYLGLLSYAVTMMWRAEWRPDPLLIFVIWLLSTVQALVMVSGAVVVSTQATSVRGANLLASAIIIPVALLLQWESMLIFWRRFEILWTVVAGLTVVSVLLVRVGLAHFNREGLLGRDLDLLDLNWAWRTYWHAVTGGARHPVEWYRGPVRETLHALRKPIALAAGLAIAAFLLGAIWVARYPWPSLSLDPEQLAALREHGMQSMAGWGPLTDLHSWRGWLGLWWHNLRAMLLLAFLGLFSFGVAGLLYLMVPFAILGGGMVLAERILGLGPGWYLLGFVLPHGSVEIPAILIFGGAVLRLGASLAAPARGQTLGAFWLRALGEWTRVMVGVVVPLLAIAAVLEAYVSPQVAQWVLWRLVQGG